MRTLRIAGAAALGIGLAAGVFAQTHQQPQDEEFARLVKEWTTRPEFLTPVVDHLPKAAGVPSPKDVLGYYVGTPKKLTHVADILRYYRALAAASIASRFSPLVRPTRVASRWWWPSAMKTRSAISRPTAATWRSWPIRVG